MQLYAHAAAAAAGVLPACCQSCQGCHLCRCCGRTLVLIMAVPLCKVSTEAATTDVDANDNRTQWLLQLLQRCSCIGFVSLPLYQCVSVSVRLPLSLALACLSVCTGQHLF